MLLPINDNSSDNLNGFNSILLLLLILTELIPSHGRVVVKIICVPGFRLRICWATSTKGISLIRESSITIILVFYLIAARITCFILSLLSHIARSQISLQRNFYQLSPTRVISGEVEIYFMGGVKKDD
jgi:predicted neutral ceramidase superfamily lipid hydrolase